LKLNKYFVYNKSKKVEKLNKGVRIWYKKYTLLMMMTHQL